MTTGFDIFAFIEYILYSGILGDMVWSGNIGFCYIKPAANDISSGGGGGGRFFDIMSCTGWASPAFCFIFMQKSIHPHKAKTCPDKYIVK